MAVITRTQFYIYLGFMGAVFFFCLRGDHWFPLVDHANLAFHEFGHPFFGAFSQTLMVYGGTIAQLIFPTVVAFQFFRKKDSFGVAVGSLWAGQNFFNIARYMGDARAQELPLVGGGEHDWTEIFSRWGCLQNDVRIADNLTKLTALALLGIAYWLFTKIED